MKKLQVIPGVGKIITTADVEKVETGKIITSASSGMILQNQRVLAVGQDSPASIKVDDIVCVNFTNYSRTKHNKDSIQADINGNPVLEILPPIIDIDGQKVLWLNGYSDIMYSYPMSSEHGDKQFKHETIYKPSTIIN